MKKSKLLIHSLLFLSLGCLAGCGTKDSTDSNNSSPISTESIDTSDSSTTTSTSITETVTITVVNGSGSGKYEIGATVTVTATVPSGKQFKEWQVNGNRVSTDNPYSFEATEDITITAIFEDVGPINPMVNYCTNIYKDHDKPFKVLTFTDIQLHDGEDLQLAIDIIDDVYNQAQPDMLVFLGDLLNDSKTYPSLVNCQGIIDKFDSYGIPWAPVFGNHDYEDYSAGYDSMKTTTHGDLIDKFNAAENCVFKVGPEEINGSSNYMVNIIDDETNKPVQSLVFMDSRLNGLQDSHVDFYNDCVEYGKELNGGSYVETIVLDHIPLPQYAMAYNQLLTCDYRGATGVVGRNSNDLAAGSENVFKAIKEKGCTHNIICGHDHENSYYVDYEGIRLAYSMKSSYGDNHSNPASLGGAMYTITSGVADISYIHSNIGKEINNDLCAIINVLPYWRYSGATLKFDIEYLSEPNSGVGKMSLMGTNILRYSVDQATRMKWWNRLSSFVYINGNRTVDTGSVTQIEGNKYAYSLDLTEIPMNTVEEASGVETMLMLYFNGFSDSNKIRVSNFRYEYEEITETNQFDLGNAVISDPGDVFYVPGRYSRPEVTVTANGKQLNLVDDILITYANNDMIGTGSLTVQPSGKGAHKYKGSKTINFTIQGNNPDDDTLPGHESAKTIDQAIGFENNDFAVVPDWHNSGKSLHFEFKRLQNGVTKTGETFKFALLGKNSNPGITGNPDSNWNRLSALYTVDLESHTVKQGGANVGTVTDIGDGWYSFTLALGDVALNESGEGAMGNANETLALIYFRDVTRSFKLDNLGVI